MFVISVTKKRRERKKNDIEGYIYIFFITFNGSFIISPFLVVLTTAAKQKLPIAARYAPGIGSSIKIAAMRLRRFFIRILLNPYSKFMYR